MFCTIEQFLRHQNFAEVNEFVRQKGREVAMNQLNRKDRASFRLFLKSRYWWRRYEFSNKSVYRKFYRKEKETLQYAFDDLYLDFNTFSLEFYPWLLQTVSQKHGKFLSRIKKISPLYLWGFFKNRTEDKEQKTKDNKKMNIKMQSIFHLINELYIKWKK
jgi:hypothetical protein